MGGCLPRAIGVLLPALLRQPEPSRLNRQGRTRSARSADSMSPRAGPCPWRASLSRAAARHPRCLGAGSGANCCRRPEDGSARPQGTVRARLNRRRPSPGLGHGERDRARQIYLELIAVVDEAEASESAFGRWVGRAHPEFASLLGWAVRTRELDDVARRLGLPLRVGSRDAFGGAVVRWRSAGIERAASERSLTAGIAARRPRASPRAGRSRARPASGR
jgi:hypothetical protein